MVMSLAKQTGCRTGSMFIIRGGRALDETGLGKTNHASGRRRDFRRVDMLGQERVIVPSCLP